MNSANERGAVLDRARRDHDERVTGPCVRVDERVVERMGLFERHRPLVVGVVDLLPTARG